MAMMAAWTRWGGEEGVGVGGVERRVWRVGRMERRVWRMGGMERRVWGVGRMERRVWGWVGWRGECGGGWDGEESVGVGGMERRVWRMGGVESAY